MLHQVDSSEPSLCDVKLRARCERLAHRMDALLSRLKGIESVAGLRSTPKGPSIVEAELSDLDLEVQRRIKMDRQIARQRTDSYFPLVKAESPSSKDDSTPGHPTSLILQSRPTYRCIGHEGSVFSVAWSDGGSTLVSTSDDRTTRVWQIPSGGSLATKAKVCLSGATPAVLTPIRTLWGHTARVWDAAMLGPLIVTGSEDCTARLWDWHQGTCLGVLQVSSILPGSCT